jgi:hypothetical protein
MSETKFHTHTKTTDNIIVFVYSFIFYKADKKTIGSRLNGSKH